MDDPWNCPPLNLINWNNFWKWKEEMATKEEFIASMKALNDALNVADKAQEVMVKYLSEQDKVLMEMDELDFIGCWPNLALILQPVVEKLDAVAQTTAYKEVKDMPKAYVPGMILP